MQKRERACDSQEMLHLECPIGWQRELVYIFVCIFLFEEKNDVHVLESYDGKAEGLLTSLIFKTARV